MQVVAMMMIMMKKKKSLMNINYHSIINHIHTHAALVSFSLNILNNLNIPPADLSSEHITDTQHPWSQFLENKDQIPE